MMTEGNTLTGGLHGSHIPLPTGHRNIRERATPRGYAWGATTGPDPGAIARLVAAGILTVTPEIVDDKPARVVRKAPLVKASRKALVRGAVTGKPRRELDDEALVKAYRDGGTIRGLAREYKASTQTIRARLELHGVYMRRGGGREAKVDTAHVVQLIASGISGAEAARRLGVSERTIRNHRRKAERGAA